MSIKLNYSNKIYVGDCFELFQLIPNSSIDLIITDSPYNANQGYPNDNLPEKEYLEFTEKWIVESVNKLKDNGSLYCFINEDYLFNFKSILDKYLKFRRLIIWEYEASYRGFSKNYDNRCDYVLFYTKSDDYSFNKLLGEPSISTIQRFIAIADKNGNVPYENLSPAHKKRYKKENYEKNPRNIFRGAPQGNVIKQIRCIHPNNPQIQYGRHKSQKPEDLISKFVLISSNEGDIVLDPFMGSGTTCVVAKKLNRKFVGFEIVEEYYEIANKRLHDSNVENIVNIINQKRMF